MLENIVTSLELSKKLLTLGVKQNSLFSWFDTDKFGAIIKPSNESFDLDHYISVARHASAFTVEEMFDLLPTEFFKDEQRKLTSCIDGITAEREHTIKHRYHFKLTPIGYTDVKWYCWAIGHGYDNFGLQVSETSFGEHDMVAANAAAKMLIYLLENGLIKNER